MAVVKGTNGSETLDWTKGATNDADTIFGFGGHDELYGGGGDDRLKGGGGADVLHGGANNDWADYSDSADGIEVSLENNYAYGGTAEGDTFDSIENVTGSAHDDRITGDKNGNRLEGGAGNDTLVGGYGGDRLDGGAGFDFADYVTSYEGVTINLTSGYASGGQAQGDTFVSIEGILGSQYDDHLTGNGANNTLIGNDGDDTLKGGGGADKLDGGRDTDLMFGGMGNDQYWIDESGDLVYELGDSGVDSVFSSANYILPDNVENLFLTGNGAINATGNALDNTIVGNDSANVINGGAGQDYMSGLGGGDHFVWSSTDHTGETEATADTISSFNLGQGDRIDLSAIDADVYAGGNQAFTFIGSAAFSGTPGEINYYHANGNTYIQMQTGMSADVEGVIRIFGIVTPEASWFAL